MYALFLLLTALVAIPVVLGRRARVERLAPWQLAAWALGTTLPALGVVALLRWSARVGLAFALPGGAAGHWLGALFIALVPFAILAILSFLPATALVAGIVWFRARRRGGRRASVEP